MGRKEATAWRQVTHGSISVYHSVRHSKPPGDPRKCRDLKRSDRELVGRSRRSMGPSRSLVPRRFDFSRQCIARAHVPGGQWEVHCLDEALQWRRTRAWRYRRPMTRLRIVFALVMVAGLSACGGSSSGKQAASTTTPAAAPAGDPSGEPAANPGDSDSSAAPDQQGQAPVSTDDEPCPDQPPCGG